MNTRPLTTFEETNLALVVEAGLDYALLFITATGLKKSILDATQPIRTLLSSTEIHDFSKQGQGSDSKVTVESTFLSNCATQKVQTSLYRPKTKKGDPRIWFSGLGRLVKADAIIALFVYEQTIHFINLSGVALKQSARENPALHFLKSATAKAKAVADELLEALRVIAASGPIDSVCEGSTAIGRSIETALGISINSARAPDFKGIEIKSGRSTIASKETRATLFACVPDWDISTCKSSAEILDNYGYNRAGAFKLYCTVSTKAPNSQSLQLSIVSAEQVLHEFATKPMRTRVVAWRLERLHKYLSDKHKETFWVKARSEKHGGKERFHLQSIIHTRNPSLPQFDSLLGDGTITLDHLIKRKEKRVSEKGPLFKIVRSRIPDLFHALPKTHSLS
jgi:hypothetical protein